MADVFFHLAKWFVALSFSLYLDTLPYLPFFNQTMFIAPCYTSKYQQIKIGSCLLTRHFHNKSKKQSLSKSTKKLSRVFDDKWIREESAANYSRFMLVARPVCVLIFINCRYEMD